MKPPRRKAFPARRSKTSRDAVGKGQIPTLPLPGGGTPAGKPRVGKITNTFLGQNRPFLGLAGITQRGGCWCPTGVTRRKEEDGVFQRDFRGRPGEALRAGGEAEERGRPLSPPASPSLSPIPDEPKKRKTSGCSSSYQPFSFRRIAAFKDNENKKGGGEEGGRRHINQ